MEQYIPKSVLVAEIGDLVNTYKKCSTHNSYEDGLKEGRLIGYKDALHKINTLEVKDPYEQCVQYDSIKAGIQAHAETYSFNIESELFHQLTKEQQKLWRKEIEQAVISGGEAGVELARDLRYKENLEVKEVDLEKEINKYISDNFFGSQTMGFFANRTKEEPNDQDIAFCAKHFFELGLKMQENQNLDDIKREWYNKGYLKGRKEAHIPARELGLPKVFDLKPLDADLERDAVSFCFDNGLNTTPHIAKTIAKHFFELGFQAQIKNVWHDYNHPIETDKTILIVSPNGNSSLALWSGKELLNTTLGGGHSVLCKEDQWAYIEDLNKAQKEE